MEISFASQFLVALISVVLGLFLGALYDVIRIIRALFGISYVNKFTGKLKGIRLPFIKNPLTKEKRGARAFENIVIFITDILYFLIVTLIMMVYIYHINSGTVRWYIFLGAILGLLLYYVTLGRLVISISEYIVFFLKVAFSYLIFFISRPFVLLYLKIKPSVSRINRFKKRKNKLSDNNKKQRIELVKIGKKEF